MKPAYNEHERKCANYLFALSNYEDGLKPETDESMVRCEIDLFALSNYEDGLKPKKKKLKLPQMK